MAQVKLTKMELRLQQLKLSQLKKYLPTLQLKKALLQVEVSQAGLEVEELEKAFKRQEDELEGMAALFSERNSSGFFSAVSVDSVKTTIENIAGIDIPVFQEVVFKEANYSLFDTPVWYELAMEAVRKLLTVKEKVKAAEKKKESLEKELREVSIRVNLFEKIMIPRAMENIKRIKIFLGDQQLAAIAQAKIAKKKIIARAASI